MYDQPLAIDVFPDRSPAEIAHLNFAALGGHLLGDRRRGPDQVSVRMHSKIVIHRELRALVAREDALNAGLILIAFDMMFCFSSTSS